MPKAADRIHFEAPRARPRLWPIVRALAPRSRRGFAGAALVAMMIGIVVNAVALQHGRRVEAAPDPAPVAAVRAAAPAPKPAPSPAPVAAPEPPRPTPTALARADKAEDPIAGLLRAQGPDKRKLTTSAQRALAKLGYPLKTTGVLDAETRSALTAYEKAHKLPATTEITAKLVKTLNAAADE